MAEPVDSAGDGVIDENNPDFWCAVGLATNTQCHLTLLNKEIGLRKTTELSAEELELVTAKVGVGAETVCLHHMKYLMYRRYHTDGCCNPLLAHADKPKTQADLTFVTQAVADSCKDIIELEPGRKLCASCIKGLEAVYMKKFPGAKGFPLLDVVASEQNSEGVAFAQKCSVGLMTNSPCHLLEYVSVKAIKSILAMPPRFSQMLVSRVGRAFDTVCYHHERVYLEGHGPACCDPEGRHVGTVVHAQLWLVPMSFAKVCTGEQPIKTGQVVCVHCFKHIRSKHPDIDKFFHSDNVDLNRKYNLKRMLRLDDSPSVKGDDTADDTSQPEDDGSRKRARGSSVSTTERQLRRLKVDNVDYNDMLGKLDPSSNARGKRRVTKKLQSNMQGGRSTSRHYNTKGVHITSNQDLCDCLNLSCPGCHYPCPKCRSTKCGHECRCSRYFVYEQIEIDGTDTVIKNPVV